MRELLADPEKMRLTSPEKTQEYEEAARSVADQFFQALMTIGLEAAVASSDVQQAAAALVRATPLRLRNEGLQSVAVRVSRGDQPVRIRVPYYRVKGGRRRRRKGLYPALVVLGIEDRTTPTLASTVSRSVAMLGSLAEAQAHLAQEGTPLDVKTVRNIAYRYARRARAVQQAGRVPLGPSVHGRRVVVSLDDGRMRVRRKKRGPRTRKNRPRYHTDWREPKLLILYVVGADGRPCQQWSPIIDGTLQGPDAVVALVQSYATQIELGVADTVLFIADGAPWIWNRIGALVDALTLRPDQVLTLIDFYHAVQHLASVVRLRRWSAKRRKRWLNTHRRLLRQSGVDRVIDAIRALCRGRNAGKLHTELMSFVNNRTRFDYATMDALKLPKGSGAMESAIRRVVNLRIKGASIYWLEDNAEAILLLRSFYKCNRWCDLHRMASFAGQTYCDRENGNAPERNRQSRCEEDRITTEVGAWRRLAT